MSHIKEYHRELHVKMSYTSLTCVGIMMLYWLNAFTFDYLPFSLACLVLVFLGFFIFSFIVGEHRGLMRTMRLHNMDVDEELVRVVGEHVAKDKEHAKTLD